MKIFALLILLSLPFLTHACRSNFNYFMEVYKSSENIYYGVVTGIVNKSLESDLISQSEGELLRISVPYSYEMRVVATDAIKGKLSKSIINGTI